MNVWVDAQLSPLVAEWLRRTRGVDEKAVRDLNLRDASDHSIFAAARKANAVVLTKDRDFVDPLERHGPPPRFIRLTSGNTSNSRLLTIPLVRNCSFARRSGDTKRMSTLSARGC